MLSFCPSFACFPVYHKKLVQLWPFLRPAAQAVIRAQCEGAHNLIQAHALHGQRVYMGTLCIEKGRLQGIFFGPIVLLACWLHGHGGSSVRGHHWGLWALWSSNLWCGLNSFLSSARAQKCADIVFLSAGHPLQYLGSGSVIFRM